MMAEPVVLEIHECVGHLVLNRPEKLNVLDGHCLELIRQFVKAVEDDAHVRAVVVRGTGRAFCAGADLEYVRSRMRSALEYRKFLDDWHVTFERLANCSKPTVAAVHDLALAGGLELTQVCDFVVVADDAEIGDQHAYFGLFPGGGSTQRLPRLIGSRRAKWLLMSAERIAPADALAYGLVNRVVPRSMVIEEASAMANLLAERSVSANRLIKMAVNEGVELPLRQALGLERRLAVEHMLGPDAREGIDAFRGHRKPRFDRPSAR